MNETSDKKIASVLVVDDEKDILKSLKDTLVSENFNVHTALNGKQGIKLALEHTPDLILLDLRLPDMDGYDVCRALKSDAKTAAIPVIIISTRSQHTDKVVGLEIGADDYLTKPYNDLELLARIRVALRRRGGTPASNKTNRLVEHKILQIDLEGRRTLVQGKPVVLTRKEFDLLVLLIDRKGKVLSRRVMLECIWGESFDSLEGTIDTHIKTLRKKIGAAGAFIETVPGIGYRWATE